MPPATHVKAAGEGSYLSQQSSSGSKPRSLGRAVAWWVYGIIVAVLSVVFYGVTAELTERDEGGIAWFLRRFRTPPPMPAPRTPRVWIHAVSAGETKVAERLRERMLAIDPSVSIVLSATTRSGYGRISRIAPDSSFVMPVDTLGLQRRTRRAIQPHAAVLAETDFWPAYFEAVAEDDVPVIAVNAILSERSARRHKRWSIAPRMTILRVQHIHAQDETARDRFASLGVPPDRLDVCGNLKLAADRATPSGRSAGRPTVTFGNVHAAELEALAPVVAELRTARPDLRVILVPRHPGTGVATTARRLIGDGLTVVERAGDIEGAGPLVWVEAMGVLAGVYDATQIAVVCGTFAPIGGHDLAEPMHHGAVAVYGPQVERQAELHSAFLRAGISRQVPGASGLPELILGLLDDEHQRADLLGKFARLVEGANVRVDDICREVLGLARSRFEAGRGT